MFSPVPADRGTPGQSLFYDTSHMRSKMKTEANPSTPHCDKKARREIPAGFLKGRGNIRRVNFYGIRRGNSIRRGGTI